jgi:hypothetical protein
MSCCARATVNGSLRVGGRLSFRRGHAVPPRPKRHDNIYMGVRTWATRARARPLRGLREYEGLNASSWG